MGMIKESNPKVYNVWTPDEQPTKVDEEDIAFMQNPIVSETAFGYKIAYNPNGDTTKKCYVAIDPNSDIELKQGVKVDLSKRFTMVYRCGNDVVYKIK